MRKLTLICSTLLLAGCANFHTTQTDYSYENGKPVRKVTTKAAASTFFESKSSLATWKASQTDKSQGATVGGLEQQSTGTNTVQLLNALKGIVEALPR